MKPRVSINSNNSSVDCKNATRNGTSQPNVESNEYSSNKKITRVVYYLSGTRVLAATLICHPTYRLYTLGILLLVQVTRARRSTVTGGAYPEWDRRAASTAKGVVIGGTRRGCEASLRASIRPPGSSAMPPDRLAKRSTPGLRLTAIEGHEDFRRSPTQTIKRTICSVCPVDGVFKLNPDLSVTVMPAFQRSVSVAVT